MIYLKSIRYIKPNTRILKEYPFSIPLMNNMENIEFTSPVTILAGENGTGKSTLLEALACAIGAITAGSESVAYDRELESARNLAKYLRLSWAIKTGKGFFMRAEDFINFTKQLSSIKREMLEELERVEIEYKDSSAYTRGFARMPFARSLHEMEETYDGSLEERSHGEGFLTFFSARLRPDSLYILDEPETPLSPMNQIALMSMINEMISQKCQFIIATHSPIMMAFPGAVIYDISDGYIKEMAYNDIESVRFYKAFLSNPEKYLKLL